MQWCDAALPSSSHTSHVSVVAVADAGGAGFGVGLSFATLQVLHDGLGPMNLPANGYRVVM